MESRTTTGTLSPASSKHDESSADGRPTGGRPTGRFTDAEAPSWEGSTTAEDSSDQPACGDDQSGQPTTAERQQQLTGSRGEAIISALEATRALLDLLESELCPAGEVLQVAEQLGILLTQVQAAHTLAVGQARVSGMWGVAGYATSAAWLRDTHRLDGGRARALERNGVWLEEHSLTRAALISGRITIEHVHALRRVTAASPRRNKLYPMFEKDLLSVAENADPVRTVAVLKAWADAVDAEPADDESTSDHQKRALHLTPVGDGWDVRGWLPSTMGANLAGVLNEVMEQRRRESADDAAAPVAARRADAMLDLAQAALGAIRQDGSGPLLGPGARSRAKIVVTVPLFRLLSNHMFPGGLRSDDHNCHLSRESHCCDEGQRGGGENLGAEGNCGTDHCGDNHCGENPGGTDRQNDNMSTGVHHCEIYDLRLAGHQMNSDPPGRSVDPDTHTSDPPGRSVDPPSWLLTDPRVFAGWWQCGNGPGEGFVASSQVRRLACDGEVQRLIVGPDSRPLDIGRSTRVVPDHMRTALVHRDGGCVMPGCQRTPGWCEAHHIQHWADGGATSIENLALMCSRHHHELHHGLWTVTMVDQVPRVTRSSRERRGRVRAAGS